VTCDGEGHDDLLRRARSLGEARIFAVEDCRHVSGRLECHLLGHGERVVRVPPKMLAGARSSARTYGKPGPSMRSARHGSHYVSRPAVGHRSVAPSMTCASSPTTATISLTSGERCGARGREYRSAAAARSSRSECFSRAVRTSSHGASR